MHVVHIIPSLHVGGAELALLRLIGEGASEYSGCGENADRIRHTVISMMPLGALGRDFAAACIPVVWLDFSKRPLRSFITLCQWLRRHQPDVVSTWMYYADVAGGMAARLCGIRAVVWGVRTTSIGGVLPHLRLRILCRLSALLSHHVPRAVVCVAEAARLSHIEFGYRADLMHVIANGFDVDVLEPSQFDVAASRALHGFAAHHIVVGHVGRYCKEKDHVGFLKAARLALNDAPLLRFVMAGRSVSPSNPVLMRAIEELGLQDHVRLLGERADVAPVLRSFDIFCLSSTFEGFPNVLGEAMAMALPCVSTDAGDARVLAGDAAEIVPISDPHAMANALLALTHLTPEQRTQRGASARARVGNHYTVDVMRQQFHAVYRSVVQPRSRSALITS
jgi:glycosyltransferase involved in cell wall biosynthesis